MPECLFCFTQCLRTAKRSVTGMLLETSLALKDCPWALQGLTVHLQVARSSLPTYSARHLLIACLHALAPAECS